MPPEAAAERGLSRGGNPMQTRIARAVGFTVLLLPLGAYAADALQHHGEFDTMYCDDDNNMVADSPADPKKWKNPLQSSCSRFSRS
jgi:hypothetical protein